MLALAANSKARGLQEPPHVLLCFVLEPLPTVHHCAHITGKLRNSARMWPTNRVTRVYNLQLQWKCATRNFHECVSLLRGTDLRSSSSGSSKTTRFKSPTFSNHGGEVAMRHLQHCFQMRKLAIKTLSPSYKRQSASLLSRIVLGISLSWRLTRLPTRLTTGFLPITCT